MEMVTSRAFNGIVGLDGKDLKLYTALSAACLVLAAASFQVLVSETVPLLLGAAAIALSSFPRFAPSTPSTVLLPIIDSCNHIGKEPTGTLSLEPSSGMFVVRARNNIQVSQQITISYGNRHNDDLLQYFGFVEENNAFDRYVVLNPINTVENILQSMETGDVKAQSTLSILSKLRSRSSFIDSPLIITKSSIENWKIGPLTDLQEQVAQPVSAFESVDEVKIGSTLKFCLRLIIEAEIRNMNEALLTLKTQSVATSSDSEEYRVVTTELFISEKLKLLNESIRAASSLN
jgi:hypothetical protein